MQPRTTACWRQAILTALLVIPAAAMAGERGHYLTGAEGLRGGSLHPPGFYFRVYNLRYAAREIKDADGKSIPIDLDVVVNTAALRGQYITGHKIFGADYGFEGIVPLIYRDISVLGTGKEQFGVGDLVVSPLILGWHQGPVDLLLAATLYLPTGAYDPANSTAPGRGFWTGQWTAGLTWYPDQQRDWFLSLRAIHETNSWQRSRDVRLGDDFHLEWGIGHRMAPQWDVGLTGYSRWQVTADRGADLPWDGQVKDRVQAIGPQVVWRMPGHGLGFGLRSQWEYGAVDTSQGNLTTFTVTKTF